MAIWEQPPPMILEILCKKVLRTVKKMSTQYRLSFTIRLHKFFNKLIGFQVPVSANYPVAAVYKD